MNYQNSASRLHSIIRQASQTQKKSALQLWGDIFLLQVEDKQELMLRVAERLVWVNNELDVLVDYLKNKMNYPANGYALVQSSIRNATSPQLLGHQSDHISQHLKPEVVASLWQMALNVPNEEEVIDSEQLSSFQVMIDDLNEMVDRNEVGEFLNKVIRRHVLLLQRAIDAYPIWGVRAFSDSLRDALGDLFLMNESRKEQADSSATASVFERLRSTWARVGVVVTEVDKVKKVAALASQGHAALSWLKDHM